MVWRESSNHITPGHLLKGAASARAHDFCKGMYPINRPRVLDRRAHRCGLPGKLIGNREGRCPNIQGAFPFAYGVKVPQSFWASKVHIQDGGEDAFVIVIVPLDGEPPFMHGWGRTVFDRDWQRVDRPRQRRPQIVNNTQGIHRFVLGLFGASG
ncbi:MAG: hypothetical protein ACREMY_27590 [bacterium]